MSTFYKTFFFFNPKTNPYLHLWGKREPLVLLYCEKNGKNMIFLLDLLNTDV